MSTGMAIMGFGGGALIASPVLGGLMKHFSSPTSTGVAETWVVLGIVYLVFMLGGAFGYRVPPPGWRPEGWTPPPQKEGSLITIHNVTPQEAVRTPQFWMLWLVLCLNVTAGIGVLGQASAMIQEMFRGKITAGAAAGFVGLLSIFNMGGRFGWASLSDRIGRKATYACFFILGNRPLLPGPGHRAGGQRGPLRRRVLRHHQHVRRGLLDHSCLPGRRLRGEVRERGARPPPHRLERGRGTSGRCWSTTSGSAQIAHGVPKYQAYNVTMYIMAGLLVLGFFCNLAVRPVSQRHLEAERAPMPDGEPSYAK